MRALLDDLKAASRNALHQLLAIVVHLAERGVIDRGDKRPCHGHGLCLKRATP